MKAFKELPSWFKTSSAVGHPACRTAKSNRHDVGHTSNFLCGSTRYRAVVLFRSTRYCAVVLTSTVNAAE
jgi:hypothetical protein